MKFQPHDYQRAALRFALNHPACGLFLPMGLGKTVVTLTAIYLLMFEYLVVHKVLIIAPKRVAESTWQDEVSKWDGLSALKVSTVLGTARQREAALSRPADIYVTNRENVAWLVEYYRYRLPFDMLVIDESTSFKNPQAKRFKALKKVRSGFSRVILLTGTPSPNSLMDLWAQMYLIDGGRRLGRTITAYRARYFTPDRMNGHIVYSYKLLPHAADEIYDAISDVCLSLKGTVHIPSIVNPIRIPLTEREMKLYRYFAREQVLAVGPEAITAANAAALTNKLLQLASGQIYDDGGGVVVVHDAKIQRLAEIVEENAGLPILVFYNYLHERDRILSSFKGARTLDSVDDIRAWNAGRIPMLLAHPASAGYGLNLQQGGHIIIWYSLTWSLEQYQQANARLCRQGQTDTVIIHQLIAKGTLDEAVAAALANKATGQDALLRALRRECVSLEVSI